jgi:hypothetical protein
MHRAGTCNAQYGAICIQGMYKVLATLRSSGIYFVLATLKHIPFDRFLSHAVINSSQRAIVVTCSWFANYFRPEDGGATFLRNVDSYKSHTIFTATLNVPPLVWGGGGGWPAPGAGLGGANGCHIMRRVDSGT